MTLAKFDFVNGQSASHSAHIHTEQLKLPLGGQCLPKDSSFRAAMNLTTHLTAVGDCSASSATAGSQHLLQYF